MNNSISQDWYIEKAKLEAGSEVGAGSIDYIPPQTDEYGRMVDFKDTSVAFGRFVNLQRRKLKLSYEELSEQADIEIVELMNIEKRARYKLEEQSVKKLAGLFNVDMEKLMELSGLVQPRRTSYIDQAVRIAAQSELIDDLSEEEIVIADAMVSVLK